MDLFPTVSTPVVLHAGPLALVLEHGDLRRVRLGSTEIIRRIYGAVRDEHWATIPGELSDVVLDAADDRFSLRYVSDHREGGLHFRWRASIDGHADGTIHVRFDGEALTTFLRNRIGLCVLHPIRGAAGHRVRVTTIGGVVRDLVFPVHVAVEQPVAGFNEIAVLAHEVEPGVWADVTFSGDEFETEDQRNWIDASYKTYSTRLSLPMPVRVFAGTRIVQEVTLRIRGQRADGTGGGVGSHRPDRADPGSSADVLIDRAVGPTRQMPPIGLRWPRDSRALTDAEFEALRALRLPHLRVDVSPTDAASIRRLAATTDACARLGCALELAVHQSADGDVTLDRLDAALPAGLVVSRLLVFTDGRATTAPVSLEAARRWLHRRGGASVPIGTGTTGDLYRIHLAPPPLADVLCWSMNPQVHAVDVMSIAETPEGARDQVESMRRYHPGLPLAISPITLRPGGAPDPRQSSGLVAAWTLAMLRALSEAGADSLTLFDAAGPGGVMDERGLFPVFHVLAAVASLPRAMVVPTSIIGDGVAAWWLRSERGQTLFVTNLSCDVRSVRLPLTFRSGRVSLVGDAGPVRPAADPSGQHVDLSAFHIARIDAER